MTGFIRCAVQRGHGYSHVPSSYSTPLLTAFAYPLSSGQCKSNKPSKGGKGKASLKKIKDMQKQLGEELSKMKEQRNSKQKGKKCEYT